MIVDSESCPYFHKTFEYDFCTCTPNLSNHDTEFIEYRVLIGCFTSMKAKPVLDLSFTTVRFV